MSDEQTIAKLPTKPERIIYAEKPEIAPEQLAIHHRFQIVIPAFDWEQAQSIRDKIADGICGGYLERIVGVCSEDGKTLYGETVVERTGFGLTDRAVDESAIAAGDRDR